MTKEEEMKELEGSICFINLTNGLEWMPTLDSMNITPHFARISSTDVENNNWDNIMLGLDANLLMRLALGFKCKILDCGTRRPVGKVIYEAVPRIKTLLEDSWLKCINWPAPTKELQNIKRKINYFKRFVNTNTIRLKGLSFTTVNDGNVPYFKHISEGIKFNKEEIPLTQ